MKRKIGRPRGIKKRSKVLSLRVPLDIWEQLQARADTYGHSVAVEMVSLVRDGISLNLRYDDAAARLRDDRFNFFRNGTLGLDGTGGTASTGYR